MLLGQKLPGAYRDSDHGLSMIVLSWLDVHLAIPQLAGAHLSIQGVLVDTVIAQLCCQQHGSDSQTVYTVFTDEVL